MWFLAQMKRTNGTVEKGVVVKDSEDAAIQGYHAYFGAYGYGHDANTDYVAAYVISQNGLVSKSEVWDRTGQGE